ncbi:DUF6477 family protein [Neptunicoccus cionae]|uniref:DUF6477 family protein n=1 Tax=Neptunicoccus cionae TaxID=2035344 RepID=UPI000C76F60D|nr:DUF6477 family protein [Amylibacter cionae]MBR9863772.1 hypothetical protein [Paracoccaceae bacterium]PLS20255.1 hypothetical protein C0U40_16550 [Amylibacter cionae]
MPESHEILSNLRRPKILISAARLGLAHYRRDADLRFITGTSRTPTREFAIETLLRREALLETDRRDGAAGYSIQKHIRVLTALLGEFRLPVSSLRVVKHG